MNPPLLDATHDPALRSWVESANQPCADFPIQNLPFAVFSLRGAYAARRCGVGIGDRILDVAACAPLLSGLAAEAARACAAATLNPLMALGNSHASALTVCRLVQTTNSATWKRSRQKLRTRCSISSCKSGSPP